MVAPSSGELPSGRYKQSSRQSGHWARFDEFRLPADTTQADLLATVDALNRDDDVDGILVQLPLPPGLSQQSVIEAIDPAKDVDGLHPINTGLLAQKRPRLRPCTPYGVITLAGEYGIALRGLRATVVGA